MFMPYDYQKDCIRTLNNSRKSRNDKALVVMASGLGKTATVGFDVRDWVKRRRNDRILYICHQNGILKQARSTLQEIVGGDLTAYGYYHGLTKEAEAQFLFASFQTMREQYRRFKKDAFDYIVVDESHHSHAETYRVVVNHFRPRFLLGVTATPDRHDLQDIRTIFGNEVFSLNLPEALARGYLTPVDYRLITDEIMGLGDIKNPRRLALKELNRRIFAPRRDDEIVRIIREKSAGMQDPRIMVFCNSIEHAERFHCHFKGSLPIHSGLSLEEQEERILAFRRGQATSVLTVDKFNEGIDIPEINIVVFLRSTQSYTIFYQQLGRGLRRANGKEKVLALDFVGNCERVRLIDNLAKEVERERLKLKKGDSRSLRNTTVVDFGRFNFTETAKDILAILQKVKAGYSEEILIAQLQNEARYLKRIPRKDDIEQASREGRTASPPIFRQCFGTWNQALRAAGIGINKENGYAKKTLILQLKNEAKWLGRTPTSKDIDASSKVRRTAHPATFAKEFGSFNTALAAAGLVGARQFFGITRRRDAALVLAKQLRNEGKRLGRIPTLRDIESSKKAHRTVYRGTFTDVFGTWEKALAAAGFKSKKLTRADLLKQYLAEAKRLKKAPSCEAITESSKSGRTASTVVFLRVFGSWNNLRVAAGFSEHVKTCNKNTLLKQFRAEAKRLGRLPTTRDLIASSKAGRTASPGPFRKVFGTWAKLQRIVKL